MKGDRHMKKTIYIFNDGEIHRKDNTIYFESEVGKKYLPVEDIGEICVVGEVGTSKKFLEFCTTNQIVIHYFKRPKLLPDTLGPQRY